MTTDPNSDLIGFSYNHDQQPISARVLRTWEHDPAYVVVEINGLGVKAQVIRNAATVRRRKQLDDNDGA